MEVLLISFILTILSTILAIRLSKYNFSILTGTISLIASEKYGWVYKIGVSIGTIILLIPVSQISMTLPVKIIAILCFLTTLGFINIELKKHQTIHNILASSSFLLSLVLINLLNNSIINIIIGILLIVLYIIQNNKHKGSGLTVLILYIFIMLNLGIVLNRIVF